MMSQNNQILVDQSQELNAITELENDHMSSDERLDVDGPLMSQALQQQTHSTLGQSM